MHKILIIAGALLLLAVPLSGICPAYQIGGINIHGFISQGYLKTNKNNYLGDTEKGTFQFNEMGINMIAAPADKLRAGVQFFARDLGPTGNDDIMLDWALIDYRWRDELGIRLGKVKAVHGLYNEIREMDMLRTSIRLPEAVYQELYRDALSNIKGIDLYGEFVLGRAGKGSYQAQVGTLPFRSDGGLAKAFEGSLSAFNLHVTEMDNDIAYLGALTWNTPLSGLRTRVTAFNVKNTRLKGDISIPAALSPVQTSLNTNMVYEVSKHYGFTLSAEWTWKDWVIAAEYLETSLQGQWDLNLGQGFQQRPPLDYQGWYVSAAYRFGERVEIGAGYSELYPNTNDKKGLTKNHDFEAWLNTIMVCSRFDINDYLTVKFQVDYNDGFGGYTPPLNPDGLNRRWFLFAAKISVMF